ncbi:MAG TPA: glutathione S-transferase family protein [Aestuariivirgaceae bacterium]|nr:glutathione S-transferase family protein [Aestuariivirgaceae bacterium]
MTLTLHLHPLASFCQKVLVALYETGIPFTPRLVDLGDRQASARFLELWPVGKIPVLEDEAEGRIVPETSIIIEYLEARAPAQRRLLPADERLRLDARLWDRFFDMYVQAPMQKIVTDRLRDEGERDAKGVEDARAGLAVAYGMIERQIDGRQWIIGDEFSLADCAAAPALFYAGIVAPFERTHPGVAGYFERLLRRASFARVLAEARPYFHMFPYRNEMPRRFREGEAG